ncbi:MAG TPA: DegT/DnrJ/EryC1/StrS family aminotransferase [Candidatus Melainabacteria bacterium]|nr:DegT/DnrJ/EryC1/StrS family aminotransferase [Candidatus Melainabacteria bacterium]
MTKVKESEAVLAINGGEPVRKAPLPWELPGAHWIGDEELELVGKVVKAQSPFRFYGLDSQQMVTKVEETFTKRWNRKHALGVSSGTAALRIALAAFNVGPGDEVLLPGYMWVSCIGAIVLQGAIPKLVDIDETFCMDPNDMAAKIGPKTKAVLVVNMSGAPGHIEKITKIAHEKGVKVLEDCAQACGSSQNGKPAGSHGDIAIFSFQLNKNITSGEGGLILCDDDTLYKRCVAIHDLGYARSNEGRLMPNDENFQMWGFGCRLNELAGAMLLAQLGKLDKITGAMRSAKWKIRRALEGTPGLEFRNIIDPEGDSGPFLITMYPSKEKCLEFTKALQAEGIKGPEGSLTCIPMSDWGMHWYYNNPSLVKKRSISADGFPWSHPANEFGKSISYEKGALPKCDELAERSAMLAIASTLSDKDVDDIIAAFKKVAAQVLA